MNLAGSATSPGHRELEEQVSNGDALAEETLVKTRVRLCAELDVEDDFSTGKASGRSGGQLVVEDAKINTAPGSEEWRPAMYIGRAPDSEEWRPAMSVAPGSEEWRPAMYALS